MLHNHRGTPIVPRNGHTLVVGIVARISGCQNQKEISLDDQVDHAHQEVAELYSGPVEFRTFATKAKGERVDRPELAEVEAALRTRELDLLFAEDLGRLVRGSLAAWLFGLAVDHGTRAISPNDDVDTIHPNWEERALEACADHVAHNAHTSKRLKHKMMNRFERDGQAFALPIAGYIVPEGVKNYSAWQKNLLAVPIIGQGLRILDDKNCSAVAD